MISDDPDITKASERGLHKMSQTDSKYPYKDWPGNNTFLCGGRCILGSDTTFLGVTTVLETGLIFVFIYYVALPIHLAIAITVLVLYVISMSMLAKTALMDPGIIPRSNIPRPDPKHPHPITTTGYKYCSTCRIYRPPRAKHCRYCDNCVLQFDHHCPWVGTCVGLRNYRYFVQYVFSVFLLATFVFATCVASLSLDSKNSTSSGSWISKLGDSIESNPASLILAIVAALIMLSLLGLSLYHISLIVQGQTTNENMRQVFARIHNPHNRGCWKNCDNTFCSKIPISRIRHDIYNGESAAEALLA
eukprot:188579_1